MQEKRAFGFSKTNLGYFFPLLMITGLVSCSSPQTKIEEEACPQMRVPEETASINRYVGNVQSLADITYVAKIMPTAIKCSQDGNEVTANMTVRIGVEEGKVNKDKPVEFQYFVAVLDPQGQILSKQVVAARATFKKDKPFVGIEDQLEQKLVLAGAYVPSDYLIVVGLILNDDELKRLNLPPDQ